MSDETSPKPGDKVMWREDPCTVLAVHEGLAWLCGCDPGEFHATAPFHELTKVQPFFEPGHVYVQAPGMRFECKEVGVSSAGVRVAWGKVWLCYAKAPTQYTWDARRSFAYWREA